MSEPEDLEEFYFPDSVRRSKKEAKQSSLKERMGTPAKDSLRGRVVQIGSNAIFVQVDGQIYQCQLRGALKHQESEHKNLITIGDYVHIKDETIVAIEERTSTLSRADNLRRRKKHLIAANVDQVLITTSAKDPSFKSTLVDRYIIAARGGNLKPIILLNKIDLAEDPAYFEEMAKYYTNRVGVLMLTLSVKQQYHLDLVKSCLQGKTSIFSGQSGVGKTSLVNALFDTDFLTRDVVQKTTKGSHTTSSSRLIPMDSTSFCVDTPGIKSFGILHLTPEEIRESFRDFHAFTHLCAFPNCSHTHEPKCGVKQAVEEEKIPDYRYESYTTLLSSDDMQ